MTYKPTEEHSRILARNPGRHAELPWRQTTMHDTADGHSIAAGCMIIATVSGCGYPIGRGWSPDSHATAAFIVKAANCHRQLAEAIEAIAACSRAELERPLTQRAGWAKAEPLLARALGALATQDGILPEVGDLNKTTFAATVEYRTRAECKTWSGTVRASTMEVACADLLRKFEKRRGVIRVDRVTVR